MSQIDFDNIRKAEKILHAMAPKIRQRILARLFYRTETVSQIAKEFGVSIVTISGHMTQLRMAGLVYATKNAQNADGRNNYYSPNFSVLSGVHNLSKQLIEVTSYGNQKSEKDREKERSL
jgi:DNA-binding transcriptional ArsR family regulator